MEEDGLIVVRDVKNGLYHFITAIVVSMNLDEKSKVLHHKVGDHSMNCPDHDIRMTPVDVALISCVMRYECSECGMWFLDLKQIIQDPLMSLLMNHLNYDNVPKEKEPQTQWLHQLDALLDDEKLELFRVGK